MPNYNTGVNAKNLNKNASNKITNNTNIVSSMIIKSTVGIAALSASIYGLVRYFAPTSNDPTEQPDVRHERPVPMVHNREEPAFVYDRKGIVKRQGQDLILYGYLFDDGDDMGDMFDNIANDIRNHRDLQHQNLANNHQVNLMMDGECNVRGYDNIKRQFINPVVPQNIPQILDPIRENTEYLFNNEILSF